MNSDLGIVDCTVSHIGKRSPGGGVGIYGATDGILLLGTTLHDNTRGEHNVRFTHAYKGVIAHNNISPPAWTKQCLTIRSLACDKEESLMCMKNTGKLIVADNHFRADNTTIMTNSGFGNNGHDRPKTFGVIWERNRWPDFRLTASSRLIGEGKAVPNAVDFAGNPRAIGSMSVGAFEPWRDPGPASK